MAQVMVQSGLPHRGAITGAITGTIPGAIRAPGGFSALDRISGRIILGLMLLLVGLSAAGVGGALLLKPGNTRPGSHPAGAEATRAANYARLPAMTFTLSDGDRLRDVRLRVVLEMDPQAQAKTVESYGPRITSAMSTMMQEVPATELRGGGGTSFIKDAVMQTASKELRPMKVRQVLLQELVMR